MVDEKEREDTNISEKEVDDFSQYMNPPES